VVSVSTSAPVAHEKPARVVSPYNPANAVTASNLFADVYILDDQTVTTASSGNSKAGRVWAVDADGVCVESYTL